MNDVFLWAGFIFVMVMLVAGIAAFACYAAIRTREAFVEWGYLLSYFMHRKGDVARARHHLIEVMKNDGYTIIPPPSDEEEDQDGYAS